MRRSMSLGMWPSSLFLIWLTFTTTFTLYIPFELAKIPQESLTQLPVSNAAAHYPQFVHRLLPYFARPNNGTQPSAPLSILSVTTSHDDAVFRPVFDRHFDEPVVVEPAIAAEVDPGARATATGSTLSTFTNYLASFVASGAEPHPKESKPVPLPGRAVDSTWYATILQGISASLRDIYHSVASTFVFPGKANRQPIAPSCTCGLSSPSHTSAGDQLDTQTGRFFNITAPFYAFWKRGQRLLGRRNIEGSPLSAGQRLAKQDPSCDCARLKAADATTDQARLAQKDIPSVESSEIRGATGEFVGDSELPRRPIPKIHDCDIDDPNWRLSFSLGIGQYRHCQPTYVDWKPQDYLISQSDIAHAESSDRFYFSIGSTFLSKSRPIDSAANGREAGLVYGLPRSDPRNRNVNPDAHFVPCRKHSPQALVIIGSLVDRLCLPDYPSSSKLSVDRPIAQSLSSDTLMGKASQIRYQSSFADSAAHSHVPLFVAAKSTLRDQTLLGHTAQETPSTRPDYVAAGAQTTAALPSQTPTVSKTATTSIDELLPLPLELAQGTASMSITYFRDRFGDTLSMVLLFVAAVLYIAVQSILAPLYAPFVMNAFRYILVIAKRFLGIESKADDRAKGSIRRQSSSSRRAAYRIDRRMSSRASRKPHPLFVASLSSEELEMIIVQTPSARSRRSVFGLFPGQLPPGTRSPAQLGSSNSTPVQNQGFVPETLTAIRSAPPRDPSDSGSCRSRSPSSFGRTSSRGRPLGPKELNVRQSSPDIINSHRKLDKGKGVDRSGFQLNFASRGPVSPSAVYVYTYLGPQSIVDPPSALQPSSSVNLPSSGSIHASARWSDKENSSPSRLPPPAPNPVDGMQVDDEGWPVKPITRAPRRLARISEEASSSRLSPLTPTPANWMRVNDEGQPNKPITRSPKTFEPLLAEVLPSQMSEPSTSSPQPAEVFYDENTERTPRAAAPKESPATQRNRRALGDLSRLAVGIPEARASPPAAPKPYIPKSFYNPRSIPGVRTFVPYYDNESDEDRHAQDSLKRQTQEFRRAEHIEERATLPRHPRTGKIIRPGEVEGLPSGARLAPIR